MRIYIAIFYFVCLCPLKDIAQQNCGFGFAYKQLFGQDPSAKSRFEKITQPTYLTDQVSANNSVLATSFTIPVVFHVLHLGGAENISDAQINDALAILNKDYRKLNADTANIVAQFKSIAADCNIQFSLATIDDNGQCTNGITRHYDSRTNWTINMADYVYTWSPSKYLNVYVVKSLPNGTAGYSYLPATAPMQADAVVILNGYIGSIGTGNLYSSRALTHEVGHWLNLAHTWGNTNNPGVACGDDGVGDTPVTKGHYNCSLNNAVDCTPTVVENIQNYMEYAYCSNMYTQGQRTRMQNCLNSPSAGRNNVSSSNNLVATGVVNPIYNCIPKAEYLSNIKVSCIGNSLAFVDQSYNAPVANWVWSCSLAAGTSTIQNGILSFSNSGLADIKLKVGNVFGNDSINKSQVITVLAGGTNTGNITLNQGFETGFFPDNNWIASVPQYGSSFQQISSAAASGSNSIWVNNYYDNPNGPISFYSPAFNFQNSVSAQLSFKYVYAQQNNSNNDVLKVYTSINCGAMWTQVYSASGTSLSTTGTLIPGPLLNPTPAQWKTENIDLLSYAGNPKVYIKFEFTPDVTGAGNNLFIDDINLNSVVGIKENSNSLISVNVFPNPFNSEVIIENNSTNAIMSIKVFDCTLRQLRDVKPDDLTVKKIILNDLKHLNDGIYFLEIKAEAGIKMIKLIKE